MECREHITKLCLPPELYMAQAKLQVNKEISKSAAGLLLFLEGAYHKNLVSRETYEKYVYRYSRKLVPEAEPIKLSTEQMKEQQKLDEKTRYFQAILRSEWDCHLSPEWRRKVLLDAEKWQDKIPEAKTMLDKFASKVLGAGQK